MDVEPHEEDHEDMYAVPLDFGRGHRIATSIEADLRRGVVETQRA